MWALDHARRACTASQTYSLPSLGIFHARLNSSVLQIPEQKPMYFLMPPVATLVVFHPRLSHWSPLMIPSCLCVNLRLLRAVL